MPHHSYVAVSRAQQTSGYLRGITYLWMPVFRINPVVTLFVIGPEAVHY